MIKQFLGLAIAIICFTLLIGCNDDEGNAANLPPTGQDQAFSIAEDAIMEALVGTITATDPDGDELSFAITSGNEESIFSLNSTNGALTLVGQLDYETTQAYVLVVEISDNTDAISINIAIEVTDVDEGDITLDDVNYTFTHGLIEDYGAYNPIDEGDATHYNYDFILADAEMDAENSEFGTGTTIGLYIELFSGSTSSFEPGDFQYIALDEGIGAEDIEGLSFFEILQVGLLDSSGLPTKGWQATDGTVSVVENGELDYTLTFDVTMIEYDLEAGEVVNGGEILEFEISFQGVFGYSDYSDDGGRISKEKFSF